MILMKRKITDIELLLYSTATGSYASPVRRVRSNDRVLSGHACFVSMAPMNLKEAVPLREQLIAAQRGH